VRRRPAAGNPSRAAWSRRRRSVQWATSSPSGTTKITRRPGPRLARPSSSSKQPKHAGGPSRSWGHTDRGPGGPLGGGPPGPGLGVQRGSRQPPDSRAAGNPVDGPGRGWGSGLRCRRGAAGPSCLPGLGCSTGTIGTPAGSLGPSSPVPPESWAALVMTSAAVWTGQMTAAVVCSGSAALSSTSAARSSAALVRTRVRQRPARLESCHLREGLSGGRLRGGGAGTFATRAVPRGQGLAGINPARALARQP
jgi:hypothetical protein